MLNYILRRKWVGNPTTFRISENSDHLSVHSTNDGPPPDPNGGYVFRWGTTSTIPGEHKTVNSAKAIHAVFDKRASRKVFSDKGMAPKSWMTYNDFLEAVVDAGLSNTMPDGVIVRPKNHIRGQDMDFCTTALEIKTASQKHPDGYYISTYIPKVKEFRVFVVSGRILGICEKKPVDASAISWGCADEEGGAFKYIKWSSWDLSLADLCIRAQEEMKIDFAAVDVIQDAAGVYYLLELNSAPSMTTYWAECFGKSFDYIVHHGKAFVPRGTDGTWKSLIHPSLTTEAKVA